MKNIGIFYGSATGTTAEVAKKIGELLGVSPDDIHNVADTAPSVLGQYGTLVLGSSTWGNGELEDDWFDFIDGAQALDLKGHKIALFGCGDETMSDTFCNAVGILYDKLKDTGATFIGEYPADGYTFDHSEPSGIYAGTPHRMDSPHQATAITLRSSTPSTIRHMPL